MHRLCLALLGLASLALPACFFTEDCDRAGCDAIDRPARSDLERGIAGAVASLSDVVANGCQECGLSQGSLEVWSSEVPVATAAEAQTIADSRPSDRTVTVNERYEEALEAGEYLVCIPSAPAPCAGITVPAEGVVSVHLRYVFGPPSLVVFEPGEDDPRTDRMFELDSLE